jgi:hypothetical protein
MRHNLIAPLRSIPLVRRTLSAISIVLSFVFALAAFGVPVATSWTYQGQLRRSGAAYTGTCNFQFTLWNAVSAGSQQGGTVAISSVNVVNGLFTVELDFGDAFKGEARWLATSVQCSGDGGFTQLDPRQPLNAAPYALSLRPGAQITGGAALAAALRASNTGGGWGLEGTGSPGVFGNSTGGSGVSGQSVGVNSAGVFGFNTTGYAIWGRNTGTGSAIYGENTGTGLAGRFVGPVTVDGPLFVNRSSGDAITGTGATGVGGYSDGSNSSIGVYGQATGDNSVGVFGAVPAANSGTNTAGVLGVNDSWAAIWGRSTGVGPAIFGENNGSGYAGWFRGGHVLVERNLIVQGTLTKQAGSFRIDHPLDPANKFLSHSFVESPDMKNIYDGNVTTDATGSATVTLPDYFAALNRDYRYQLTVLGQFAQAIVSRKIAGNTFEIRTDKPGVEVSWQVTGIRQDAYAKAKPIVVEEFKPAEQKGFYLYPAGFGASEEKRIGHSSRPATAPGAQEAPAAGSGDQARSK